MNKFFYALLVGLGCLIQLYVQGQPFSTESKKAIGHFEEALSLYDKRMDAEALEEVERALQKDERFIEAWMLKGDILSDRGDHPGEISAYQQVILLAGPNVPQAYLRLGRALFREGRYDESQEALTQFLSFRNKKEQAEEARFLLSRCEFAQALQNEPVPFDPVNLGPEVNSVYDDYMPSLTADESVIVITRNIPISAKKRSLFRETTQEDFFVSTRQEGDWSSALSMGPPVNTDGNEGAQNISADGRYMFFTACHRPDGYGSCDIYFSKRIGNQWSEPVNLGAPINTGNWESQPCFSSDGQTLYYVSNRPGGKGHKDIWSSQYNEEQGYWSVPVNLGDSINTRYDEMSPFIHPDNQTLYFSSDGHPGLGMLDLYFSRKKGKNKWSKPKNLGFPINTHREESFLFVNARGDMAYFASDRPGSRGMDIYSFDLYPEARPVKVSYVKGKVFDSENRTYLPATIEMINLQTKETVAETSVDPQTGEFLICLPTGYDYALQVRADHFLFHSENFSLSGDSANTEPIRLNIPLRPIKAGNKTILRNIFFDTNSYSLRPESESELENLVDFLHANPTLRIEISGHTDDVGQEEFNLTLSSERARSVYTFLTDQGIPAERLSYKGYGETQPISGNETEEGRAQNRRTEFKIL